MQLGFIIAMGAKASGAWGIGRKAPTEKVVDRTRELMDARLAEYAAMDAAKG